MKMKRKVLMIMAAAALLCVAMMSTAYGAARDASDTQITGISFTPAEPYVLTELRGGYWTIDSEKKEYYRYWLPTANGFKDGDKLVVTISGYDVEYIFVKTENAFVNGGDKISRSAIKINDKQGTVHWELDKENTFEITYQGITTTVPVTLTPSRITSISYTPAEPYKYYEFDLAHGRWEDGGTWFSYMKPNVQIGDVLTVKTTDDPNGTDYVYDAKEGRFISEGGDSIKGTDVTFKEDQNSKHWYPDTENAVTVLLERATCTVNVVIEKSQLESVAFTPVEPYKIEEGDTDHGNWVIDNEGNIKFVYRAPDFQDGDILTLKKKGQDPVDYVFTKKTYEFVYGDEAITHFSVSQKIKGDWAPGADNKLEITYLDQKCDVDVTVLENPVKSIGFTPVEDLILVVGDENDGEWYNEEWDFYTPYFNAGDVLSVTTAEGTEDYTFDDTQHGFVCGDKMISTLYVNNDEVGTWEPGKQNEMLVFYAGRTVNVPVTIIEAHNHEDSMVQVVKTEPTCAAYGYDAHYDCSKCGKHFLKDEGDGTYEQTTLYKLRIDKLAHTLEEVPLKKATAASAGNYQYWTCTVCHGCFSDAEGINEVTRTETVIPKNNFKVTVKKKLYTAKSRKKTVIKAKNLYNVKNKKGKVTYKKAGGNSKIKVAGNGAITVAKGLKKGKKYVVKVKVTSAGNAYYKACSKTVKVNIKVK